MGIRTITLKLYKPSKRKREIIDEAMENYSRAYQFLLDKAYTDLQKIEKQYKDERGGYRALNIGKWIDRDIAKQLNVFRIEPFKDSLKIDFSITMASFLSLKSIQEGVSYPIAYITDSAWKDLNNSSIEEIEEGMKSADKYLKEMRRLGEKCGGLKPIFFCRYALNRDYCILYDEKNDKYYAKLYLMNVRSDNRKELNICTDATLSYIHKNGGVLEKNNRKERFIIIPLSFGKWQEEYLKMARENPDILKTARLIKKNNDYYLSINIVVEDKERIKTETFLGLARGLKNAVHYTVVGKEGKVLSSGVIKASLNFKKHWEQLPANNIHEIANEIIDIAGANKSQLIVQAFIDKGDRLQWIDEDNERHIPVLNYRSYNSLLSILEYKLDGVGLPSPVKVSPVGIFYTCPNCGLHASRNRFSRDMFICIECGTTMDIESLGSLNIARKLIRYSTGPLKVKVEKTKEGIRFINKDIGLDFSPLNPMDCFDEFSEEIKRIISEFHENINNIPRDRLFKRKYSLIKKIEEGEDLTKLVEIV